jgi:hypothetical protein
MGAIGEGDLRRHRLLPTPAYQGYPFPASLSTDRRNVETAVKVVPIDTEVIARPTQNAVLTIDLFLYDRDGNVFGLRCFLEWAD